jgi:L-threonylcarbamoyladenylate synthase
MMTLRLTTSEEDIITAAKLLRDGNLVAFPTETVYGLGADIYRENAIEAIYRVKGRPLDNPLIVHIGNKEDIHTVAIDISVDAEKLIEIFFPGPLTLVLKRHPSIHDAISKGLPTIAVRMPSHPVALSLIQKTGHPIAAPSANLSGKPSPTTAQHVLEDLDGKIAAVIDGGSCEVGIESTVIDMTNTLPVVVRPGKITAEELSIVLDKTIKIYSGDMNHVVSPGMKYRHYAPTSAIHIIDALELGDDVIDDSVILSNVAVHRGSHTELVPLTTHMLFAAFRMADKKGYQNITVVVDEETKKQEGLMNRLQKAAAE